MLNELQIRNLAIIEEQTVSFRPGLNVISGETGAGKSIVLAALELILGAKPKGHLVRDGAEQLEVQALFSLDDVPDATRASFPEIVEGDELLLARTLNKSGRGRVFINGRIGSISMLEEISGKLMNICGQGQQIRLLDAAYHGELLDHYAGLEDPVADYRQLYELWRSENQALEALAKRLETSAIRRDTLVTIINEIKKAEILPGFKQDATEKISRLANSEKLILLSQQLIELLGEADVGVLAALGKVEAKMKELVTLDPGLAESSELLGSAHTELIEFERDFSRYAAKVTLDPEQLETLREKLAEVLRLERKYKTNEEGLCQLLKQSEQELLYLDDEGLLSKKQVEVEALRARAVSQAKKLSQKREQAANKLAQKVGVELKELNMPGAQLEVQIDERELCATGIDRVEFLICSNRGEPFKPLRQIASGGELSRITLVLKKLLRDRQGLNVLVFDEVDAGVSGSIARAVGQKLRELAAHSQVVCITHLPQIASLADHHLLVNKTVGKRTVSVIRELDQTERIEEIARMLAGYTITQAARESARELIASNKDGR